MKSFDEFLQESEATAIVDYVRGVFEQNKINPTIGKHYLMKAPNGKPMLYVVEKIVKAQSIEHYGVLLFGKVGPEREFYLSWTKKSSTGKLTVGAIRVIQKADAVNMFKALGISAGNVPETTGINAKDVPEYVVLK